MKKYIMSREDTCAICLNNITNDIFISKCNHKFHNNCIKEWCKKNNSCPSCRVKNILLNNLIVEIPESPNILRDSPLFYDVNSMTPSTATTVSNVSPSMGFDVSNNRLHNIIDNINNQFSDLQIYSNNTNIDTVSRNITRNRYRNFLLGFLVF
mgnify:CR=1 FL=1